MYTCAVSVYQALSKEPGYEARFIHVRGTMQNYRALATSLCFLCCKSKLLF